MFIWVEFNLNLGDTKLNYDDKHEGDGGSNKTKY